MKENYWSCTCGYLHIEPHHGMTCKCGAVYNPATPAPPLSDARVERAARVLCRSATPCGMHINQAKRILAAADAVPEPAVDWTSEVPTEPGEYWGRSLAHFEPEVFRIRHTHAGYRVQFLCEEFDRPASDVELWWPVRIEPPPTKEGR